MYKKGLLWILILLTICNFFIFVFRNHFQYQPYADMHSLYAWCDESCKKKWEQYVKDYPATELKEAKFISDSIIGIQATTTYEKILSIGAFLYNRFHQQSGTPATNLLTASPLSQYHLLYESDSLKLWCGNFAQIFSWFCWSQGIITRNIEIMNPGDRHVLNECYIPETGTWAMTDVTHNLLLVQDMDGVYLDLPVFMDSLKKKAVFTSWESYDTSFRKVVLEKSAAYLSTYYQQDDPLYYYQRVDNNKAYKTFEKIKRYFLPFSWFDILNKGGHHNLLFYIKEVLLFLWIISIFGFMSSLSKFRK